MNRTGLIVTFLVAFLIAGAAGLLVLRKLRQTARASGSTQVVVAAVHDLEIGTKLTAQDLKTLEWSGGSPPNGFFSDPEKAVGRAVQYPVFKDEVVLEAKLAPVGAGAGLPAVIPEGMRAVSIRVDDVVAVAGFVGPGTKVDVLLTGNPGTTSETLTKTILENVQVLAAGPRIQPDAQGKPEKVNVVTLLCTPEDAAKVTLAASDGRIQLVLRNPTDKLQVEKKAVVRRAALYGEGVPKPLVAKRPPPKPVAVVVPPPPPPPAEPVKASIEMVRGEKITTVEILKPLPGEQRQ
jgi:pilus assembly protein CpaB